MESTAAALGFSSVTSFVWFLAIVAGAGYIFAPMATKAIWARVVDCVKLAISDAGLGLDNLNGLGKTEDVILSVDATLPNRIAEFDSIPSLDDASKWAYLKSDKTLTQALKEELAKRSKPAV